MKDKEHTHIPEHITHLANYCSFLEHNADTFCEGANEREKADFRNYELLHKKLLIINYELIGLRERLTESGILPPVLDPNSKEFKEAKQEAEARRTRARQRRKPKK